MTARQDTARALHDLARETPVTLRVRGTCMVPALAAGEVIEVRAARFYWPGDIVAFAAVHGELTVHRVIGWRPAAWTRPWVGWRLWTQADDGRAPDTPVSPAHVIGKVSTRPEVRVRAGAVLRMLRHVALRASSRLRPLEKRTT